MQKIGWLILMFAILALAGGLCVFGIRAGLTARYLWRLKEEWFWEYIKYLLKNE